MNPIIETICGAYHQKNTKLISRLYNSLMNSQKNTSLYVKAKWERELNVTISEEEWYQSCCLSQTSTNSMQWREFNWKCIIRFFITPHMKSKQLQIQQPCWRGCGSTEAHHTHIFWICPKIQAFWTYLCAAIKKILGYGIPRECSVMFLGNIAEVVRGEDQYLTKILLTAARKAITRLWLKPNAPDKPQWINIVEDISQMEKLTYSIRLTESDYNEKWRKWTCFKSSEI